MTAPSRTVVGIFQARVLSVIMAEDHIDVFCSALIDGKWTTKLHDRDIRWRGYYGAATARTCRGLIAMGASLDERGEPIRIGSEPFAIQITKIECSLEETGGRAGIFRVFVRDVISRQENQAVDSEADDNKTKETED